MNEPLCFRLYHDATYQKLNQECTENFWDNRKKEDSCGHRQGGALGQESHSTAGLPLTLQLNYSQQSSEDRNLIAVQHAAKVTQQVSFKLLREIQQLHQ